MTALPALPVLIAFALGAVAGWVARMIAHAVRAPAASIVPPADPLGPCLTALSAALGAVSDGIARTEMRVVALDARLTVEVTEQNRMRHDALARMHSVLGIAGRAEERDAGVDEPEASAA